MRKILFAIAVLILSLDMSAQKINKSKPESCGMSSKKLELIDSLVNKAVADKEIPGAVVSVQRGDKIVYLKAFGNKQIVPDIVPMTTDVIFDLASLSKCVGTTMSFMQLVEQGKVRISDNVKRYFPDFKPWTDPKTGESVDITIQDLLTHSSGLDSYISVGPYIKKYGENTPDQLMKCISTEVGRGFRPGTDFRYSCLNFIVLQNILEKVTGQKLCDYAKVHVFEPLHMNHTSYFPLDREVPEDLVDLCAPTEVQADGLPLTAKVHDPLARLVNWGNSGNAGVFSTAEDLAILASVIMNEGRYGKDESLLGKRTIEAMCRIPSTNKYKIGRCLGWDKHSSHTGFYGDIFDKAYTIGHTGYTGTSMLIDMKSKVAVIVLTNRVHPEDKGAVGRLRGMISNVVAGAVVR